MKGGWERPKSSGGAGRVLVECLSCGHTSTIGPDGTLEALPLVQLTRRLRCSECGSRAVKAARVDTPRDLARVMRARMDSGRH